MYRNTTQHIPGIDNYKMQTIEDRLRRQEDTTNALLDRAVKIKEDIVNSQEYIKGSVTDERKNRQLLEEHIRVITAVCKKLNLDIESLEAQVSEKAYLINNIDHRLKDTEALNSSMSKDIQYKISRNENALNKIDNDHGNLLNTTKDLQAQFHDFSRGINSRMNDIEHKISDLTSKFDSVINEQSLVLRNVEGDTMKQFQLIDGRTRAMFEDIRGQVNSYKISFDNEVSKIETRLSQKIEDSVRNHEKNDRFDRKLEELSMMQSKRQLVFEEEFQRSLSKIHSTIEKLEQKVYRGVEEKQLKLTADCDKLKKDLKTGFESVNESIGALEKLNEGKIRLVEEKLIKDIDKVRKMVIMI